MRLLECPETSNAMSFGIAHSSFATTDSNGMGKSAKSWGIIDGSRGNASVLSHVYADNVKLSEFRKMQQGDVFSIRYYQATGTARLSINDSELVHDFQIHGPGAKVSLVMGATFANVSL